MTAPADTERYKTFKFDFNTGVASEGVWLCIAQLPSRTKAEIEADSPCPQNVEVLRELLGGEAGTAIVAKDAQPDQIPVVVCPEYSFSSADWAHVDALVDAYPGPLVLVAGLGQCASAGLDAIREVAHAKTVELCCGWAEQPNERPMNFGSVWIKYPGRPRSAVLFGKNFLEAKNEDFGGVYKFRDLTEIELNDLRILPFICADAIETPKPGGRATVGERLAHRVTSSFKPALCVGSLLQPDKQASEKWVNAIDRTIHGFGESQAVLVISNVATSSFDSREGGDKWRNLSGIYVSKRMQVKGQKHAQESTGYFESATLMAWPLRSNLPQVVFGTLGLPPYTSASGVLHPWNASPVRPRCSITNDKEGRIQAYVRCGIHDELVLLSEVTNVRCNGADLKLSNIRERIESGGSQVATRLIARLLDGPLSGTYKDRSVSDLCELAYRALGQCLACIDVVLEGSKQVAEELRFSWAAYNPSLGEIVRFGSLEIPVAMWWSISSPMGDLLAELRTRVNNYGPIGKLRVFGKGIDGDFDPDIWREICRDTTSAADVGADASGQSLPEYADLSTLEATSIEHVVKPTGFQLMVHLTLTRCGPAEKFSQGYERLVRSVQS